jgi:hypothetical protein
MIALFAVHAMYVGVKYKIPRTRPDLKEMGASLWELKWELCVPALVLGGLGVGLASIDEAAAIASVFVIVVELLIHRDLKVKDMPRIVGISFALAGALLLIMAMAVALTNYLITQDAPAHIFEWITSLGVTKRWHFLVARNFLMYAIGAVMEGFSAILVAVPLLLPFGARFLFSPFHLAMMFLLDLEIAFLSPPFGQNLFVTSFRFRKPMTSLYRIALPFLGIMFFGLTIIMFFPGISTIAVQGDIKKARAEAARLGEPPRDSWMLECVQEDRNNPLPCTDEDRKKWGHNGKGDGHGDEKVAEQPGNPAGAGHEEQQTPEGDDVSDELLKDLMADPNAAPSASAEAPKAEAPKPSDEPTKMP